MARYKESKTPRVSPIMDMLVKYLNQTRVFELPVSLKQLTESELLEEITKIIETCVKNQSISYDPSGIVAFSLPYAFDWFQELTTGEQAYVFLRRHFTEVEGWDSVSYTNPRTGITYGRLALYKRNLTDMPPSVATAA